MKKTMLLILVMFILCLMPTGCSGSGGIPNGTYVMANYIDGLGIGETFTVKGNIMTIPIYGIGGVDYTYKIDGKDIKITAQGATLSFPCEKKGDSYIIDGAEYVKETVTTDTATDTESPNITLPTSTKQNVSLEYDGVYCLSENNQYQIEIKNGEVIKVPPNVYGVKQYVIENGKLSYLDNNGIAMSSYTFIKDSILKDNDEDNTEKYEEYVKEGGLSLWAYEMNNSSSQENLINSNNKTFSYESDNLIYINPTDNNAYILRNKEDTLLLNDVKYIPYCKSGWSIELIFFIKTNNELWGFGSNRDGILGDGTGVDRTEPVKILDDVAVMYGDFQYKYAIKNDKTLWRWGQGIYTPEKYADDIVAVITDNMFIDSKGRLLVTGNGFFRGIEITDTPTAILKNVKDVVIDGYTTYVIYQDGSLIRHDGLRNDTNFDNSISYKETILFDALNKVKTLCIYNDTLYVVLENGEYWGISDNTSGELGDNTKISRNEFVKIMDNVVSVGPYKMLLNDGTFMTWNQNDPIPKMVAEGVAWIDVNWYGRIAIKQNGELWVDLNSSKSKMLKKYLKVQDEILDKIDPIEPKKDIVTVHVKLPNDWKEPFLWAHGSNGKAFSESPGKLIVDSDVDGWLMVNMPGWVNEILVGSMDTLFYQMYIATGEGTISIEPGLDIWLIINDYNDWELSYSDLR